MVSVTKSFEVRFAILWLAAVSIFMVSGQQAFAEQKDPPPGEYRIVNGRVDVGTYTGWRIFHSACHTCHGVDAVGTARAPDLVESVQRMTPRVFVRNVLRSYGLIASIGGQSKADSAAAEERIDRAMDPERKPGNEVSMPAWGEDSVVRPHVLDLFAYLTARADGLEIGEPKIIGAPR